MVIVQFNLDMDGRKAADDDACEKVAAIRPLRARRSREARVSRFDPASRPVALALTSPDGSRNQQELTTFADQVVRKAAGERARRRLGDTSAGACEINIYPRGGDGCDGHRRRAGAGRGARENQEPPPAPCAPATPRRR